MGITPLEMLKMQEGFLSKLQFESFWGIRKLQPNIGLKIKEVRQLLAILE
jgi:hypothetical protein